MIDEKVNKFLKERGYKFYENLGGDSEAIVANYFRVAYGSNVPDCLSNEKPPQIHIKEAFIPHNGNMLFDYHAFTIGIRNEAPQGWTDFNFYSLQAEDILNRLDELENALLKVWSVLFEKSLAALQNL